MLDEREYFLLKGLFVSLKCAAIAAPQLSHDDLVFTIENAKDILADVLHEPREG